MDQKKCYCSTCKDSNKLHSVTGTNRSTDLIFRVPTSEIWSGGPKFKMVAVNNRHSWTP